MGQICSLRVMNKRRTAGTVQRIAAHTTGSKWGELEAHICEQLWPLRRVRGRTEGKHVGGPAPDYSPFIHDSVYRSVNEISKDADT